MSTAEPPLVTPAAEAPPGPTYGLRRVALLGGGLFLLICLVRVLTGAPALTSSGTIRTALELTVPIMLAALGALYAERAGVINIGLEGMMILGTWCGAWAGFEFGIWWGVALGIVGGALGGLLHAVATVSFGVDHIVSGVAINILGLGLTQFLSNVTFAVMEGGGPTQSPTIPGSVPRISLPVLSSGADLLGGLERQQWFLVSDLAGVLRGLTGGLSVLTIIAVALVPLTFVVLWQTRVGLRLRSCGENPQAAESLGVNVYRHKYIGVVVSGALAGFGGAYLVTVAGSNYQEGQTGGRGFLGLAAMIFGNWRPGGAAAGSSLFGFVDALRLRDEVAVHALLLLAALALALVVVLQLRRGNTRAAIGAGVGGAVFLVWFLTTTVLPSQFLVFMPHVVTLLVLTFLAQRLRPPAADGQPYRRGEER